MESFLWLTFTDAEYTTVGVFALFSIFTAYIRALHARVLQGWFAIVGQHARTSPVRSLTGACEGAWRRVMADSVSITNRATVFALVNIKAFANMT